jgi:hypothetical protein
MAAMGSPKMLTSQQTNFFETLGLIKRPGLLREDIQEISTGSNWPSPPNPPDSRHTNLFTAKTTAHHSEHSPVGRSR